MPVALSGSAEFLPRNFVWAPGQGWKPRMRLKISVAEREKSIEAVFFFQDWGEGGLRVVLRARMNGAGLQAAQGFDHEIGADGGEARGEGFGGVVGGDGKFLLQEDVAGVEAGVDAHGGDAGDGFAVGDGPLNRRGAAIFREQRGVQVDVAERREIEHPLGNDAAVADDDDGVGLEGGELGAEFVVGLDAVGLGDGKVQFQGGLFDGRWDEFEAAAFGAVGLSDDEMDAESGGDKFLERGDGEARGSAENEIEGLSNWVIGN